MIRISNTLTRTVEEFRPIDSNHIRMYVCGPTVYARPHIGNARSIVVYDMLYRLLQHDFQRVTYVRNITDVDDKINAAAVERGISIQALTGEVTQQFHDDMGALNALPPTIEPRATEHIAQMIALIESLIAKGFAYAADGHVLFRVQKDPQYGQLSRRTVKDMVAGARVEVAPYKEYAGDFVLWKPASEKDDASSKFDSPWGVGRPGWHIECSAMAATHLGDDFDIHGGGSDLMFPHHENEIAQSTCGHPGSHYAKYWVHNGFLTVDGEKMSKSLGNFITVHDLLSRGVKGEVIRLALLSTQYRKPLDWSDKALKDANSIINTIYAAYYAHTILGEVLEHPEYSLWRSRYEDFVTSGHWNWDLSERSQQLFDQFMDALRDDMNTPLALSKLFELTKAKKRNGQFYPSDYFSDRVMLKKCGDIIGLIQGPSIHRAHFSQAAADEDNAWITAEIEKRNAAKKARDFATSDAIRDALKAKGIILEDSAQGTTWRRV